MSRRRRISHHGNSSVTKVREEKTFRQDLADHGLILSWGWRPRTRDYMPTPSVDEADRRYCHGACVRCGIPDGRMVGGGGPSGCTKSILDERSGRVVHRKRVMGHSEPHCYDTTACRRRKRKNR